MEDVPLKPLEWGASSRGDLKRFPEEVRRQIGHALHLAQAGEKSTHAKPLRGFGGAGVLEVVASHDGNAFRAMYTVRFAEVVYVLHAFQKKATKGIATPKAEIDLVKKRLAIAIEHYKQVYREDKS